MNTAPGSHGPTWRTPPPASAVPATPSAPGWQVAPPRTPYRPRWRRLAAVAVGGLAALAAVTWVVLWIRPPEPARLVVLQAGYDATLAVPPNPYGKAAARELATLTKSGGWLGSRARLHGSSDPGRLTRPGPHQLMPEIDAGRERCVVVVLAAHGGRDRDGAFLFPDDATPDPAHRLRVNALVDRLAQLPADRQKLLVLDAAQCMAFPDLGLLHNDFAAAVEDLNDAIAAVPNLVVFMSTGSDQRSWVCPEWEQSTFAHFLHEGLTGAADADGDRRVSGWEVIEYVRPRVHDWARDHRAALQSPVVLPRGGEGERRARAMHLAMAADGQPSPAAPTPFEPPTEIRQAWEEYRALAHGTPPPQAYTPHLWRQYEAWVLRQEQHLLAGDADGARAAREKAADLRRRIEDDRRLGVRPQTLALPVGVGSVPQVAELPASFIVGIARVANPDPSITPAERLKEWEQVRPLAAGLDPESARLLWATALLRFVAEDPAGRLPVVPVVLPFIESGFAVRPAELHFLAMLAAHAPPPEKSTAIGPLLSQVLSLRERAEAAAACVPGRRYPYAEVCQPWVLGDIRKGDESRRPAEDLCFATGEKDWGDAATRAAEAGRHYTRAVETAARIRSVVAAWHTGAARVPGLGEWLTREAELRTLPDRLAREAAFRADLGVWGRIHAAGELVWSRQPTTDPAALDALGGDLDSRTRALDTRLARQVNELIETRPEFEGKVTPRAEAVRWWHETDAALTAPPPDEIAPARRVDLLRESRRVSRQLLVTARTRPERLPDVSPELTRERAFDAARRRGLFLLARIGRTDFAALTAGKAGDGYTQIEFRVGESGFPAAGRQSLAEAGSRLGEVLSAIPQAVGGPASPGGDRLTRLATAPAEIAGNPAAQLRRVGTRALLLAQARRTLEDHWYDGRGGPYYRLAIEQLAADAGRVSPAPAPGPDEFASLKAAAEEFPVQSAVPARVAVTDEPTPEVRIPLTRPTGVSGRPGFAVFWAELPFPPTPKKGELPPPPGRVPVATDPAAPLPPLVRPLARPVGPPPATPLPQSGPLRVNGFYRGRFLAGNGVVDLYSVPHQAAVTTPPVDPFAKLAVRADPALAAKYALGSGSVAIVLDCSGSMRPDPTVRGNRGLYPTAVDALGDVLAALPPGATVSVRTFGQRTPGAKSAEDTIRVMVPPTSLPFDRSPVLNGIVYQASGVTTNDLYDKSPVVRAVLEAKESLKTAPGPFKAVVLISDAVDTRFAEDPAFASPKRSIPDVLRAEFTDSGVPLCVVALPVWHPAELAAQAAFKVVEKLRPAGRLVPPEKAKELGVWLRSGLSPRVRYTVEPVETDTPVAPFDLTATADPPDDWFAGKLPRGRYRVRVAGDLDFRHDVWLGPGDRLLLDLIEDGARLSLKRHWFAATTPALARAGGDEAWKLALLQNRFDGGKVRMVATAEGRPPTAAVVAVDRIGDVWFEVAPVVPRPEPVAVRWRAVSGFPGPSWSVDVTGWPGVPGGVGAAAPMVEAWWNADGPYPTTGDPWVPPDLGKMTETRNVKIGPGEGAVTLDAVTIETHRVEVRPGEFEPRPCLVARLTHPAGRPVWVRPVGTAPLGSEVRFYRDANKVTCLYWWETPTLTADDVAARVTGFGVVSLATAKAGPHLELKNVPAPSENSPVAVPPAGR
ncbi:MAG: hypothetical protein JWO38_8002 [Gemmataceae bacterium]|nr:hypothetical protein [Gemmataceae bacterium]